MNQKERTRIRKLGTSVTNPADFVDPGLARILAMRRIVAEKRYAKIDGLMIDLFSASAIVSVYDALSNEAQCKFRNLPAPRMAGIAFKLMK